MSESTEVHAKQRKSKDEDEQPAVMMLADTASGKLMACFVPANESEEIFNAIDKIAEEEGISKPEVLRVLLRTGAYATIKAIPHRRAQRQQESKED